MKRNTVSDGNWGQKTPAAKKLPSNGYGVGQLTLAEHSLCPLDARASLQPGLLHRTSFQYSDAQRRRKTAKVEISCPQGLLTIVRSRFLNRRERLHENVPEGSVSCGGELAAYGRRVFSNRLTAW